MIELADVTKRFGDHVAVDRLSFTASSGQVTGFLGPNGAGKSTSLGIAVGLQHADSGTASISGRPYRELSRPLREVGVMMDAASLPGQQTPSTLLRWLATANTINRNRVDVVLEQVGLGHVSDKKIREFSLGMRQRAGLAVALLGDPGVVILDEPVNGLDPEGILWIRGLLRGLADDGRTVLLSSHLLTETAQIADEVVVIAAGRLVAQTTPRHLVGTVLGNRVVIRSADNPMLARVLHEREIETVVDGDYLVADSTSCTVVGTLAFDAGIAVYELFDRKESLEDAFLELTGAGRQEADR